MGKFSAFTSHCFTIIASVLILAGYSSGWSMDASGTLVKNHLPNFYKEKPSSFPSTRQLIISWNFETNWQNWTTSSNGSKNWYLAEDGEETYTKEVCEWVTRRGRPRWDCSDERYEIRSNDQSQFIIINSEKNNGTFRNIGLTSPTFSTRGFTEIELDFWHYYRSTGSSRNDTGYVEYSTDNGGSWATAKNYTRSSNEDNLFIEETIYQLPGGIDNMKIRFRYDDARNSGFWAIDNLSVTGIPMASCETDEVQIVADFCAPGGIELNSVKEYSSYSWQLNGVEVGTSKTLVTDIAGTYTLRVTDENGCSGSTSTSTSEELVVNGDFEEGYNQSFRTDYTNAETSKSLQPEGYFVVDRDANDYHSNFYGRDHTTGNGKFLIVNGHPDQDKVIWEQTVAVRPNISYYFSAWGVNLHASNPAKLQLTVNGVPTGTVADLTGKDVGEWVRFHSPEFWNSGSATTAVIRIINLNTTRNGNDFGLDDISFGNLDPIPFDLSPPEDITICAGQDLQLFANIEGGRDPAFVWRDPRGAIISREENPIIENVGQQHNGTYTLSVIDFYGCEAQLAQTEVNVDQQCNSIDFDGKDDHIVIGDHYNFTDAFTLEAWIKPHSLNTSSSILSKGNDEAPQQDGYSLKLKNEAPVFTINNQELASPFKIDNDRWYHLAASFDGTTAKLFIDGREVAKTFMDNPKKSSYPLLIGAQYTAKSPWAPVEYFHGWIEEVRIWKKPLSPLQVRFMMNQRIEEHDGTVRGIEIPLNAPENLKWNDLEGYYQLLSNKVQQKGFTEDMALDQIPGQLRNMETFQDNTAPLPYFTARSGSWNAKESETENPWAHPEVWDIPNSKGVDLKTISWNIVRLSHDITSGTQDITLLGLISEKATFRITDPSQNQDEYNPGIGLHITKYLKLDGIVDLVGESQLIQVEGSILEEESKGYVERDQQGTASSFNYNYWASPVGPTRSLNNGDYTIKEVLMDGTDFSKPGPLVFNHQHNFADQAYTGAKRISTYWLHKYTNSSSSTYSEWKHVGEKGSLKAAEGYSMKGTMGSAAVKDRQNYVFRGKPNNGTIQLNLSAGNDYLIGNPYPSSIDGYEFIKDNLQERSGGNVFNGALYFWDHFSGKSHILREYVGGYATLNLSGGTVAVATDERINATGEGNKVNTVPQQFIPVGQAFFVGTALDPRLEEVTSVTGGKITFRNSQRVFETDDQENDRSIFKSGENQSKSRETGKPQGTGRDLRMKIYLKFISPTGYHRQILVTADPNASQSFDLGYDAPSIEDISEDMYWLIENVEFIIQGVKDFDNETELDLGLKVKNETPFSVSIDRLENLPENKRILLRDNKFGTLHDLRERSYELTEKPGVTNNRLTIVFRDISSSGGESEPNGEGTDGENEEDANEDREDEGNAEDESADITQEIEIMYTTSNQELLIRNPSLENISSIHLFNILGQEMGTIKEIPLLKEVGFPVQRLKPGVYFVELRTPTEKQQKKIIINN